MSLISQAIKNLKGGISQQPDILRFPDQGAAQINGFSSEVEGLQKRPPSKHLKRLGNFRSLGGNPNIHLINRDKNERYFVVFNGSTVRVFNLLGTEIGVSAPNGWGYVNTANPRDDLKMVTVADYTFVVNKNWTVTEDGTLTHGGYPRMDSRCIVNVRGGQYGKDFVIHLNGHAVARYTTPLGDKPEHIKEVDTQFIVGKLVESANSTFAANGWNITAGTGTGFIMFTTNGSPFFFTSVTCQDGFNNQLMNGFISDVQKFNQLPAICHDGYIVKVNGEAGSDQDDYYVRYSDGNKVWKETVKPLINRGYHDNSMPHALIRQADGTFTFQQLSWQDRTCGDDESNPMPSFVGSTINDVFFFRNRLGFLSGENVILSRSGEYFKMFPLSVANLSDTDPIDVAVSNNRISVLKHAVPFSEDLLLWSEQSQFTLTAAGILTPTSVQLDLTTEFDVSDQSRPFGIGRGVYYCAPRATYSSIRRYYAVQDVSSVKSAEDISAHVPSYIPNGVFKMSGSSTENFLTVLTEGQPSSIFMYKFLYLDEQLAQQSWSCWDFGRDTYVLAAEMVNAVMYLILDTPSGIFLESLEFTQNTKDYMEEPYRLFIDRKIVVRIPQGAYNDDLYQTHISLSSIYGESPSSGSYYAVDSIGAAVRFDPPSIGGWPTNDALVFNGNREGEVMVIGEAYEFKYEFSKFLIKKQDSNGGVTTEDIGRLQLKRAWVNYERSGSFRMQVASDGRKYEYTMTGNRLSSRDMILGDENLDTGQFRFPIQSEAKRTTVTCVSDTPNPVALIGCGWEGNYNRRTSGI